MKISMQTIGTILVAIGLLIGVYSFVYHGQVDYSSKYERDTWYGEASPYVSASLVVIGLILSIVGASRERHSK